MKKMKIVCITNVAEQALKKYYGFKEKLAMKSVGIQVEYNEADGVLVFELNPKLQGLIKPKDMMEKIDVAMQDKGCVKNVDYTVEVC